MPEGEGVLVQSLIAALPAELAGLQQGDVIIAINDESVSDVSDLRIKVSSYPPGESIQVRFRREGGLMEKDVVLADPENPYGTGALRGQLLEGVEVAILDEGTRQQFGLEPSVSGLVVVFRSRRTRPMSIISSKESSFWRLIGCRPHQSIMRVSLSNRAK